jgi:3',5'-nucleoside bisphosphate phosphatase
MIIDFHTHSNASDGVLSPADLVEQAIAAGIECLAITDHDTVEGYKKAKSLEQTFPDGFRLCPGVELSCRWGNDTIHVVGLELDIAAPELVAGLAQLAEARRKRAITIAERLEKQGFVGALEGALALADGREVGRPDFARWMVDREHVKSVNDAFDKYLGAGKIGDVKAYWPELQEVVAWISAASGAAVLAHPLKYKYTRSKLRRLIADFKTAGGGALEIYSGRQTEDHTTQLKNLQNEFGLLASAGSDFHGKRDYGPTLGVDVTRLGNVQALWGAV